jgi:hypothetical protein
MLWLNIGLNAFQGSARMTAIRGFAIFVSVFLFAALGQASAQGFTGAYGGLSQPDLILAGDVWHGGRCPRLCVEWFDGCNTCSCGKGHINSCTEMVCRGHKRPRCLRWGF